VPTASPTPSRPSLALVAERLEAIAHELGWGSPPLLIEMGAGPADRRSAGLDDLPPVDTVSDDPVADLLGYVLTDDCSGLAVVTEGNGRRLADGLDVAGRRPAGPVSYRLAYVLDRDGRAGFAVRPHGGEVTVDGCEDGVSDGPSGRLVDVCHRALGLPTAPPPPDTERLWLVSWLDLLLARSLGRGESVDWPQAARLHPTMTLLDRADAPRLAEIEIAPDALARMGAALGRAQSWEDLRRATAAGEWSPHAITAEHAAWMDAGMYARWVTGEFLPPAIYLRELHDVLDDAVAERVRVVATTVHPGGPIEG
jgi:hypothetical protein